MVKLSFDYDNTYFDTPDNSMFLNHHNGKLNRVKVRIRKYIQTNDTFLEIKCKTNKGRTIKERIGRLDFESNFTLDELRFLEGHTNYPGEVLEPKIRSYFNRFTLVDKKFTERVTIDLALGFKTTSNSITIDNLVVIEIKQNRSEKTSLIVNILKENKIRAQSFSKYCIGRSLLEEGVKKNKFKPTIIRIRKEFSNQVL